MWYKEQSTFPEPDMKLARWIGVAKAVSHALTYLLLTEKCAVVARSSVIQLQGYKKTDPVVIQQQETFLQHVLEKKRLSSEYEELFIVVESDSNFADLTLEICDLPEHTHLQR